MQILNNKRWQEIQYHSIYTTDLHDENELTLLNLLVCEWQENHDVMKTHF